MLLLCRVFVDLTACKGVHQTGLFLFGFDQHSMQQVVRWCCCCCLQRWPLPGLGDSGGLVYHCEPFLGLAGRNVYYSGVLDMLLLCRVLVDLKACQGVHQAGLFFAWV